MTTPEVTLTVTTSATSSYFARPISLQLCASSPYNTSVAHTSAITRRKLQNRSNQKAFRARKAAERSQKDHVFELGSIFAPASSQQRKIIPSTPAIGLDNTAYTRTTDGLALQARDAPAGLLKSTMTTHHSTRYGSWCRPFAYFVASSHIVASQDDGPADEERDEVFAFEESFLENLPLGDLFRLPADDHLLSLMYYNVFRALASNARILGCNTNEMHADDYPSPFIVGSINSSLIPLHLRPTELQLTCPHHPCFDIFPDPVVRDTGIMNTHMLPHGMLCMTLAGRNTWFESERSRRTGLVIWGPPEEPSSWEVTEGFAASFGWLVVGSFMLECSTNRWRARRNEAPIFFA